MIDLVLRFIVPAAYSLLPEAMQTPKATAMLLAIALQESKFEARVQYQGPATSFFQFEITGVRGVLTHPRTAETMRTVLRALRYGDATVEDVHAAILDNDVLAVCLARCLLWTDPGSLPRADEGPRAWRIYRLCWQPGKPRPETWPSNFSQAWARVTPPILGQRV